MKNAKGWYNNGGVNKRGGKQIKTNGMRRSPIVQGDLLLGALVGLGNTNGHTNDNGDNNNCGRVSERLQREVGSRQSLTDDDQRVPLPAASVLCAHDGVG
jgi:hypothetical protein